MCACASAKRGALKFRVRRRRRWPRRWPTGCARPRQNAPRCSTRPQASSPVTRAATCMTVNWPDNKKGAGGGHGALLARAQAGRAPAPLCAGKRAACRFVSFRVQQIGLLLRAGLACGVMFYIPSGVFRGSVERGRTPAHNAILRQRHFYLTMPGSLRVRYSCICLYIMLISLEGIYAVVTNACLLLSGYYCSLQRLACVCGVLTLF
jgi:hypothetical protein